MAVDTSDEIVQDFLVEAGEILEQLGGQLVDLEQQPDDRDLLNGIFRGFHTIKGGAGFLALHSLVEVSHKAEDVFDLLRRGERSVDAMLMDVMLRVLDVLNDMFGQLRGGEDPAPAPPDLLEALIAIRSGELVAPLHVLESTEAPAEPVAEAQEQLSVLAAAEPADHLAPYAQPEAAPGASDEITEEEFEILLDKLHGSAPVAGGPSSNVISLQAAVVAPAASSTPQVNDSGDITEQEFEALLDQLQGARVPVVPSAPLAPAAMIGEEREPLRSAPVPPVGNPQKAVDTRANATRRRAESGETEEGHGGKASSADSTVRVETAVLDQIMNMVGELVLIRNRLSTLEVGIGNEEMTKTVQALDVVTSDLQMAAMKTRMQPIKKLFGRFPRVVRDVMRSLKKEVDLILEGEETDLDKNLVEALADPLVHLVRNSMDHGIELPEVRQAAGKPVRGTLRLAAEQAGDHILLTIHDDGAGMDPDVLRRKAVEKGLMDEDMASRLSPQECFSLIFHAGFSTKAEVSDISGRGVGMDVVKTRIAQLNGQIEILSEKGKGTTILIKLPLTLAIMPVLMVMLGRQIFALPLVNVNEIIDYDIERTSRVDGREVMVIRGKALPLFYLSNWLVRSHTGAPAASAHVVVVSVGTQRYGLLVDQLIGQEEVVIKPLGALLQGTRGLSGATITGDGRIALILDLPGLVLRYGRRS